MVSAQMPGETSQVYMDRVRKEMKGGGTVTTTPNNTTATNQLGQTLTGIPKWGPKAPPSQGGTFQIPENNMAPATINLDYKTPTNPQSTYNEEIDPANPILSPTKQSTNYAPEYSKANQQALIDQYAAMMEPAYAASRQKLKASLAGTGGLSGSPMQYGLGNIETQRLSELGQYGMGLANTGTEQTAKERLIAEGRGYEDPFRIAELTGSLTQGGKTASTIAGRQLSDMLKTSKLQREYIPKEFDIRESGVTGNYNGGRTMAGEELDLAKMDPQQQEAVAKKMGFANAYEMNLSAQADPTHFKERLNASGIPT